MSGEEVRQVVHQISSLKAQGLDDMHAIFYQKCWLVVDEKIFCVFHTFLTYEHLFKDLNQTYISLIYKKDNVKQVSDHRPISLCKLVII